MPKPSFVQTQPWNIKPRTKQHRDQVAERIAQLTNGMDDVWQFLVNGMHSTDFQPSDRVRCAVVLAEYGVGRPVSRLEVARSQPDEAIDPEILKNPLVQETLETLRRNMIEERKPITVESKNGTPILALPEKDG